MPAPEVRKYGDLKTFSDGTTVEVSVGPIKVQLLSQADISDPLNQFVAVYMKVGDRFALKVTTENHEGSLRPVNESLSLLIAAVIDHHAEIRDAIAMESK